jgi:cation:H+ antiporter
MSLLTGIMFIAGIFLLIFGADLLVRGASQFASTLGVPPLIIGLTVVAFGTSAPELAVSLQAALTGKGDLTLGNVIGSNIANLLLILGIAAMVGPLPVAPQILRRDLPFLVVASLAMLVLGLNGNLGRTDGIILFAGLLVYFTVTIREARSSPPPDLPDEGSSAHREPWAWLFQVGMVAGGLALLVVGADWLVNGATAFARLFGVSELVIGLTIVAIGTSLPEIATSVIAGLRGERDIAVGNVIGSNMMNILAVLGLTTIIDPDGIVVPLSALQLDLPVMVGATLICLPLFFTRKAVTRREGILLLLYYGAYLLFLVLTAIDFEAVNIYGTLLGLFVIPITVAVVMIRALRYRAKQSNVGQQATKKGQ